MLPLLREGSRHRGETVRQLGCVPQTMRQNVSNRGETIRRLGDWRRQPDSNR
jgi:hypothetical protein